MSTQPRNGPAGRTQFFGASGTQEPDATASLVSPDDSLDSDTDSDTGGDIDNDNTEGVDTPAHRVIKPGEVVPTDRPIPRLTRPKGLWYHTFGRVFKRLDKVPKPTKREQADWDAKQKLIHRETRSAEVVKSLKLLATPNNTLRVGNTICNYKRTQGLAAIFNAKGAGKTTTGINVGNVLSVDGGFSVLLIPATAVISDTLMKTGASADGTITIRDLLAMWLTDVDHKLTRNDLAAVIMHNESGVYILAPDNQQTPDSLTTEKDFGALLHWLRTMFDIVIADGGNNYAGPEMAAMRYADQAIFPFNPAIASTIYMVGDTMDMYGKDWNVAKSGTVMNSIVVGTNIMVDQGQKIEDFRRYIDYRVSPHTGQETARRSFNGSLMSVRHDPMIAANVYVPLEGLDPWTRLDYRELALQLLMDISRSRGVSDEVLNALLTPEEYVANREDLPFVNADMIQVDPIDQTARDLLALPESQFVAPNRGSLPQTS